MSVLSPYCDTGSSQSSFSTVKTEVVTYEARRHVTPLLVYMRRQQCVATPGVQEPRDNVVEKGRLAGTGVVADG